MTHGKLLYNIELPGSTRYINRETYDLIKGYYKDPEPEFELEFTRKDKSDYRWYINGESEPGKPKRKASTVGKKVKARSKGRGSTTKR